MSRIEIFTDDLAMLGDLKAANIPGLKVYEVVERNDDADFIQQVTAICNFVIDKSIDLNIGLLGAWLYDRVKNRPNETVANGVNISGNPEHITVILNNILVQPVEKTRLINRQIITIMSCFAIAAIDLTRRSTSLPSVAGRCAIKPRSAG